MTQRMKESTESALFWAQKFLMPGVTFLLMAVVSLMGYVGNQIWSEARGWMRTFDNRVTRLEIQEARSDSSRFTSGDWAQAKQQLDEDRANLDRRITLLEEAVPAIKESLLRIETKIDKMRP